MYGYPQTARVKNRRDYLSVQREGRKVHTPHFIIVIRPRERGEEPQQARLGITVTRKIGNAVARNRVKRLVREVFRTHQECFSNNSDFVFIAKRGSPSLSYVDVRAEVMRARRALGEAARARSGKVQKNRK